MRRTIVLSAVVLTGLSVVVIVMAQERGADNRHPQAEKGLRQVDGDVPKLKAVPKLDPAKAKAARAKAGSNQPAEVSTSESGVVVDARYGIELAGGPWSATRKANGGTRRPTSLRPQPQQAHTEPPAFEPQPAQRQAPAAVEEEPRVANGGFEIPNLKMPVPPTVRGHVTERVSPRKQLQPARVSEPQTHSPSSGYYSGRDESETRVATRPSDSTTHRDAPTSSRRTMPSVVRRQTQSTTTSSRTPARLASRPTSNAARHGRSSLQDKLKRLRASTAPSAPRDSSDLYQNATENAAESSTLSDAANSQQSQEATEPAMVSSRRWQPPARYAATSPPDEPRVARLENQPEPAPADDAQSEPGLIADGQPQVSPEVSPAADENLLLSLEGPQLTASATGPRRIVVGRESTYLVNIRNAGVVEANDVIVTVNLPPWVDVIKSQASRGTAQLAEKTDSLQPVRWRISRLEARSNEELKLIIVPKKSQSLNLAVRWTYAHAGLNTQVVVEEPLLQMVISGPSEAVFGETKLYNLTVSNPGTGDAENVMVTLLPLGGKENAAATTSLGTVAHGETKTIQVELTAGKSGTLLVKAHAEAEGGLTTSAAKEVLVRRASLQVNVTGPEAQYAGNVATYQVRVVNTGNATAEDVNVTAFLPQGGRFVSDSAESEWIEQQGRVRWDVGALAAGQEETIVLMCRLSSPGDNRLRVTSQDKSGLTNTMAMETNVVARADLKLAVSDPSGPVPVGEIAEYEVRIFNRGTKAAEGIEAVIFFSDGIEPASVTGAANEIGRGQVVFKTIPIIRPDDEIRLKIKSRAERPGNHVFRAEVLCRSLGTKLAAEETTHFYGKELANQAPSQSSASKAAPIQRKPHAAAPIDTEKAPAAKQAETQSAKQK